MKLLCTLLVLGLAAMPAGASDAGDIEQRRAEETGRSYKVFKTRLGWTYRDVTVTQITDAGISIIHADGSARLGFDRLTPEQREQFGITEEGAEARVALEEKAQAAYEAHLAAKQKEWREQRQKAQAELLARQTAARLEAERLKAQPVTEPQDTTSIVSVLEVPRFPIIKGPGNQILRPIASDSRPAMRTSSRSSSYHPVYYGGTYYHPGYPGCGATYRPSQHRGSWGWINYRKGNFTISTRW